jgi:hypothetical protein
MATTKSYTASVAGGFWPTNGVGSLTNIPGSRSPARRFTAQAFGGSRLLYMRELIETLNGQAPGVLAFKSSPVIAASTELGGVRAIVQVPVINRVTTAADKTEIDEDLWTMTQRTTFGANPPANLDRNPLGTR